MSLKYEDNYDLGLKLTVNSFSAEYGDCGSHQIVLDVVMDLTDIDILLKQIQQLKLGDKSHE